MSVYSVHRPMMESDDWASRVRATLKPLRPACSSPNVTPGACAIGSATVHQEFTWEDCQFEFTAMFVLARYYEGCSKQ